MQDLVSIVMPAYNCASFIEASVQSVLAQTYHMWELIIVEDCATDNTRAVVEQLMAIDTRIKGHFLEENGGVANARNTAIDLARGRYIAFLDSDDLWKPHKLERHLDYMQQHNCQFTFSCYDIIDENGTWVSAIEHVPHMLTYKQLLNTNPIGCLTVVLEACLLNDIRMPLIKHEDFAMWLTVLDKNDITAYGIQEILASYRKHSQSTSANKLKTLTWTWRIYRENRQMNLLAASVQMMKYLYYTIAKYIRIEQVKHGS